MRCVAHIIHNWQQYRLTLLLLGQLRTMWTAQHCLILFSST